MPRKSRFTPEIAEAIVEAMSKGLTRRNISETLGLGKNTVSTWLKSGLEGDPIFAEFADRCAQAEKQAQGSLIAMISEQGHKDWRAAAWLLERRFDQFKLRSRTSADAQAELDRLNIEKAQAELTYTEAKTKALNRGSLTPEQILELLERAKDAGKQEAEEAVH
jgi:transposase